MDGYNDNLNQQQFDKLQQLFPEAVTEGKIDWQKLQATLGEAVDLGERYGLSWKGKSDVFATIQEKTVQTLHPDRANSVDLDTTSNMFIEGNNLAALKILHKAYYGKVKMIYIDPPYNTGNDFIYNDDFKQTRRSYEAEAGITDDEGNVVRDDGLRTNTGGHKHSNWLNMMYPRLFLARNLLRQDGVIFVSIDDNEVHNLRLMMNEIFGEENFVAQIIIQANKGGQDYKDLAKTHEYILCYSRSENTALNEVSQSNIKFSLEDDKGGFNIRELRNRNPKFGRFNRPNLFYPIFINPHPDKDGLCKVSLDEDEEFNTKTLPLNSLGNESCWRWGRDRVRANISELVAKQKADGGWNVYEKHRKTTTKAKTIWDESYVRTEQGTIDIRNLDLGGFFDHPKPVALMQKLLSLSTQDNDIVLDFFSGSGTTAHVVMQLNAEDGGNRQWICVQLPELTDEKSEAYKAGYRTIADIARERIRRACAKIRADQADKLASRDTPLDLGFRAYRVDDSNFKQWNELVSDPEEIRQQALANLDSLEEGTTDDGLLTELLLKRGISPLAKVEQHDGFCFIPSEKLAICLTHPMTEELFATILATKPSSIILLDRAFGDDINLKVNLLLQAERQGVEVEVV